MHHDIRRVNENEIGLLTIYEMEATGCQLNHLK
jgi:hypothetical protein